MTKNFYVSANALTIKMPPDAPCGPTVHAGCKTNRDWVIAECAAQNKKRGHKMFVIREDGQDIWIELRKQTANWRR